MALENTEVIDNLTKQKEDIETKFEQFASQKQMLEQECERLRIMHGKISGALEVLTQIEDSKNPAPAEAAATEEAVEGDVSPEVTESSASEPVVDEEGRVAQTEFPAEGESTASEGSGEAPTSRFAETAS